MTKHLSSVEGTRGVKLLVTILIRYVFFMRGSLRLRIQLVSMLITQPPRLVPFEVTRNLGGFFVSGLFRRLGYEGD